MHDTLMPYGRARGLDELHVSLFRRRFSVALVVAAGLCGNAFGAACPNNLQYLANKLPRYNDSVLLQMRQMSLDTDLQQALEAARRQGYNPQQAAAATLAQAKAAEQAMPVAEQCVRQSSSNASATLAALRAGTYAYSSGGGSISAVCMRSYVLAYYQYVVDKEAAVGLACWASSGSSTARSSTPAPNAPVTRSNYSSTRPSADPSSASEQPDPTGTALDPKQVDRNARQCLSACDTNERVCKSDCGPEDSVRKPGQTIESFKREIESKYACRSTCVDTLESCMPKCQ